MADITEAQVEKKRDAVSKLSDQVEDAKRQLALQELSRDATVEHATLTAEEERLKAELEALRDQLKVSKVDPAKDQVVQQIDGSLQAQLDEQEQAADAAIAPPKEK
jgi:hypothetical protein